MRGNTLGLLLLAASSAAFAASPPDLSKLAPWPERDGNYLQALKGDDGEWYLASGVVKSGKFAQALGLVEQPSDPSAYLMRLIPGARMYVRGLECESLSYTLITDPASTKNSYWLAAPRGTTTIKRSCQIKNTPEKWVFLSR